MTGVFRITKETGDNYMITPMSKAEIGKYLIQANSESEAASIRLNIGSGDLKSPLVDKDSYQFVKDYYGSPVYRLKK